MATTANIARAKGIASEAVMRTGGRVLIDEAKRKALLYGLQDDWNGRLSLPGGLVPGWHPVAPPRRRLRAGLRTACAAGRAGEANRAPRTLRDWRI